MTKTEFTIVINEVLNYCDCKLIGLRYFGDGLCKVIYSDGVLKKNITM